MSTTLARTARVPHLCDSCYWSPSLRGVPTIGPGHRYLRHVAFPGDDGHEEGTRPWALVECVACACERDATAGLLQAGACSGFCCGTTPCARPDRHAGGHACRTCLISRAVGWPAAQGGPR